MVRLSELWAEPIDAVVFDMDGTLLDSESVFRRALFNTCTELGFEMTDDLHLTLVGGTSEHTRQLLANAFGSRFPFNDFYDHCTRHIELELSSTPMQMKPGAWELVDFLREQGIAMAVATSSTYNHASRHLDEVGLLPHFGALITRDDVTNPKPHPEPFLMAASKLGLNPSRCIAIEDSSTGVRSANAAGMKTIMVPDLLQPCDDTILRCRAVLKSLTEVHSQLKNAMMQNALS